MTFNPALTTQDLVWLAQIEPARRLEGETWTHVLVTYTNCYYIAHPEGKPSRVRECLKSTGLFVTYTPDVADLTTCNSTAKSWYWDAAQARLYVHTSTAADPGVGSGLFYINSYFWERLADRQVDLVDLLVDTISHPYRPLLDPSSITDLSFEATQFSEGGIAQSFGSVVALNPGGYWDSRLADYVYEGKRMVIRFGYSGDAYADYIKLFDGYTGGWTWTDGTVVFDTEDPRRFQE
jgi:hypothetical protein